MDVEHVHAVAARAGHAKALGLERQVGYRRMTVERRAHPELVVDDQEDDRQLPERGQVHRLAEGALVGGAVAHHREDRVVGLEVVAGERDAGRQRQAAADDAVAAEEAPLPVEQVHRAAAALRAAVDAPEQLRHDGVRMSSARERLAVLAVGRHQVVGFRERLCGADDRGLLADAEVQEAADLRLRVHLTRALLEAADQHHLREDGAAGVGIGQAVLDLSEADLLAAGYLGLSVLFLARGVLGGHRCGLYPVMPGFKTKALQKVRTLTVRARCGTLVEVPG